MEEPLDTGRLFQFVAIALVMEDTSVLGRWFTGGCLAAMIFGVSITAAQTLRPLAPLPLNGLRVAPIFEGWYQNADGSVTMSFGYSNPNVTGVVEIPAGPDNFIEPKEFDGRQPTVFTTPAPEGEDRGAGGRPRRERQRGVFTVTVPPGFKGEVVWTLRYNGITSSVPASTKTGAYGLRWPMAMGSIPPLLRFSANGQAGRGPSGIDAPPMQARVGTPLPITIWLHDDSDRISDPTPVRERGGANNPAMNVNWSKHSGPVGGAIKFDPPRSPIKELQGTATTTATFERPGDYVVRVTADNFGRLDTSSGNQCCWTNGYIKVGVTP
jgi:hypothetical protein